MALNHFAARHFAAKGFIPIIGSESSIGSVGGGFSRKPRIVIVPVDGTEYRVPIDKLAAFLDAIPEKVVKKAIKKVAKARKSNNFDPKSIKTPKIAIKQIKGDNALEIRRLIDYANERIASLWNISITRKLIEWDDEEIMILLVGETWH